MLKNVISKKKFFAHQEEPLTDLEVQHDDDEPQGKYAYFNNCMQLLFSQNYTDFS